MTDQTPIPFPVTAASRAQSDTVPVWHRLNTRQPDLENYLCKTVGLDELTMQALTATETRPRSTPFKDGALVILRAINTEPGQDPEDMVSLRMWVDASKVVTLQTRRVAAADDLEQDMRNGRGASGPGEFLVSLADRMTDRMQDVVDTLDTGIEELEDAQADKPVPELRGAITDFRRKVVILRRFVAPQRDALDVLVDEKFTWQTDIQERRLKEATERITRLVEQLDTLQQRASIIQDYLSMRVTERLNRTMLLLSVVGSVFLPLTFVSGLLGMNVSGIPLASVPEAFMTITGLLILVGIAELILIWRLQLLRT
jgi:zinc transporter